MRSMNSQAGLSSLMNTQNQIAARRRPVGRGLFQMIQQGQDEKLQKQASYLAMNGTEEERNAFRQQNGHNPAAINLMNSMIENQNKRADESRLKALYAQASDLAINGSEEEKDAFRQLNGDNWGAIELLNTMSGNKEKRQEKATLKNQISQWKEDFKSNDKNRMNNAVIDSTFTDYGQSIRQLDSHISQKNIKQQAKDAIKRDRYRLRKAVNLGTDVDYETTFTELETKQGMDQFKQLFETFPPEKKAHIEEDIEFKKLLTNGEPEPIRKFLIEQSSNTERFNQYSKIAKSVGVDVSKNIPGDLFAELNTILNAENPSVRTDQLKVFLSDPRVLSNPTIMESAKKYVNLFSNTQTSNGKSLLTSDSFNEQRFGLNDNEYTELQDVIASGDNKKVRKFMSDHLDKEPLVKLLNNQIKNLNPKDKEFTASLEEKNKISNESDFMINQVVESLVLLDQIKNHKGFDDLVGAQFNFITFPVFWGDDTLLGRTFSESNTNQVAIPRSGTDAYGAWMLLENLKAKNFISSLIDSKKAGAVYGALSNQEGKRLTDEIAALSIKTDPKDFRDSLNQIKRRLNKIQKGWWKHLDKDKKQMYGGSFNNYYKGYRANVFDSLEGEYTKDISSNINVADIKGLEKGSMDSSQPTNEELLEERKQLKLIQQQQQQKKQNGDVYAQ